MHDDETRRFRTTWTGTVSLQELADFLAAQILLGRWKYSVLHDATAPHVDLTVLARMPLSMWRELREERGPRGPVPFAVADDGQRAIAIRYAAMATAQGVFLAAAFRDVPAAESWLNVLVVSRDEA